MSLLRILLHIDPSRCPYYRRGKTCRTGCWEEPHCVTGEPLHGWPLERLYARGRHIGRKKT